MPYHRSGRDFTRELWHKEQIAMEINNGVRFRERRYFRRNAPLAIDRDGPAFPDINISKMLFDINRLAGFLFNKLGRRHGRQTCIHEALRIA